MKTIALTNTDFHEGELTLNGLLKVRTAMDAGPTIFTTTPAVHDSLSDAMDRLHHEKHAKFRQWQDARVMNMIFGENYVTVPAIPKGYEEYAKQWYDNLKPVR
ncbi:MAG TPA: hypothetical protein VHS96_03820 [Bacteroidia bacterium]|nr:hypothetical protein [Bacteroidia bacterium]